ncbi:MAG: DUF642 domain-containing protein [Verrucomicrobiales bacterium]
MSSSLRLPRALATAPLFLATPAIAASFVLNPSFENDYNETWPHYGPISDWVHQGGTGTNRSDGPFHNAGTPITDRDQVALLQGTGFISQTITGLTAGQTYWIQFFYDVRACCGANAMDVTVKWNEEEIDKITGIVPVIEGNPYRFRNVAFTAAADTGTLTLATTATGDATALFDGVTIVPGDPGRVAVANPSFEASGTPPDAGYLTAGAGWTGGGTGGVGVNAAGGQFANNGSIPDQDHVVFIQGASYIEQSLRGLVSGETYSVAFRYNATTGNSPTLRVTVDGATRFEQAVTPVGGNAAYSSGSATFVAAATTAVLRLEQMVEGNQTVLIDDIRVSGVVVEPIPNLSVGPPRLELGPGQRALASFTVSGRRLETGASTVQVRIPNESVARLVDADANGIVTLVFPQGTVDTTLTTAVEGVGRGAVTLEIVDNGGHDGVDGTLIVNGVTSFLVNPSFEATGPGPGVGYSAVLSWTGGSGINNATQPFLDNGALPDREQVAFIQGSAAMSQSIAGLIPNQRYAVQFFYNVRNCCGGTMQMTVRLAGTDVKTVSDIVAVGAGAPFYFLNVPFTPTAATTTLEIASVASGDATLLVDGFSVVPQAADETVVMNPSFEASGVPAGVGYQNAMAGWASTGGHGVNVDTVGPFADNGVAGAQDRVAFLQGPSSLSQIVPGVVAGSAYSLEYLVNARNGDTPGGTPYKVMIDGLEVLNTVQEPVGVGNPYTLVTLPFTASADSVEIRFEGLAAGTVQDDQSLLLDDVRIRPAGTSTELNVPLTITLVAGNSVNLSWPTSAPAGLILQSSTSLRSGTWSPVTTVPFVDGSNYNVLEVIDVPARYYRLARP